MTWNISAECIAALITTIIFIYSHSGMTLPTLKNKVFRACLLVTMCAILSNIASTMLIAAYPAVPAALVHAVTYVYFISTPLMSVLYFYYTIAVLFEYEEQLARRIMLIGAIPMVAYLLVLASNPFTGAIYALTPYTGYVRGPLIWLTYAVLFVYCSTIVVFTMLRRRRVERMIRRILMSFPVIALSVVCLQVLLPGLILTGTAGCCSLLILYLYLQNKQLSIDPLTGLSNRMELLRGLRFRLHNQKSFSVLVLSLNSFKLINDKAGTENGDCFLQKISLYLRRLVEFPRVYRYAGDQFAIVLDGPERSNETGLIDVLRDRFRQPWEVGNHRFVLPYSIATIDCPDTTDRLEELVSGIERALAVAKQEERVCSCSPEMLRQVERRSQVEDVLKTALDEGSFEIFLQPIYAPSLERFDIAESLLRLNKTPIGPIFPDEFIPIAEQNGLIVDITYWVLERVCTMLADVLKQGIRCRAIAVNLSAVQFLQKDCEKRIVEIIERSGVPFEMVKFEVTESVLISNYEPVKAFINAMCERGCRFGLDDFGTGYSNLSAVLLLPFDTIKIDKSLVWLSETDERYAAMVRHLTNAFRDLGLHVLAEGVETKPQDHFIRDCGCDFIQGYYYARPLPVADAISRFEVTSRANA